MSRVRPCALALAVALLLAHGPARAADEAQVLVRQAEQLAAQDRCDAALEALRRARQLDPGDARAASLEGQCEIRLRRYEAAIAPLEEARRLAPGDPEAALYLGMARYHAGDLDGAGRALDAAAAGLPDRAELHLYRGLLLLERARAGEAALELERASSLDPELDPAASYFAGRAWQAARDRDRAERALDRARAAAPGSSWAQEADRALEGEKSRYRPRGWWGRVLAGVEYDDNVVLRGSGVVLPSEISDEKDVRGVWSAEVGTELLRDADWAVGVRAGHYGTAHGDLGAFDTHYPTFAFWVDRALGERTYLRVQPDLGHAWIDGDAYLLVNGASLSAFHAWEDAGTSRPFFRWERRDYDFDDGDPVLDRDGHEVSGGYEHQLLWRGALLRGAALLGFYDTQGSEYEHLFVGVRLAARRELVRRILLDVGFRYSHQRYENDSSFSSPPFLRRRRDDVFGVDAALERQVWGPLRARVRYRYENDVSNVAVFDYDRHQIGAFLVYEFGSP